MISALNQFENSIKQIRDLEALHSHLKNYLLLPNDLTDLLRSEIVYAVSALDKLIHELVRIGMIDIYCNRRISTNKYDNFSISLQTEKTITNSSSMQPPEYWIEQEIVNRHKYLSFQDPQNIADALSLIWNENHKWQKIGNRIGQDQRTLKIQLKNIVFRRNQIVHESDIDIVSGTRNSISESDAKLVVDFIDLLGKAIYEEVK